VEAAGVIGTVARVDIVADARAVAVAAAAADDADHTDP
jgi:hypothetical protein